MTGSETNASVTDSPNGLPHLQIETGVGDLLTPGNRALLERDILPAYVRRRRWFAAKDQRIEEIVISYSALIGQTPDNLLLAELSVRLSTRTDVYLLPLAIVWTDAASPLAQQLAIATVTIGTRDGILTDGFAVDVLPETLIAQFRCGTALALDDGELRFIATPQFTAAGFSDHDRICRLSAEQSNSSLLIGRVAMLKLFRRIPEGIHPEVEMSEYLTKNFYANTPPLLGAVWRVMNDGARYALVVVQGFVANQGDGWGWSLSTLKNADGKNVAATAYVDFASAIGRRLAELHAVLGRRTDNPDFAPAPANVQDAAEWAGDIVQQFDRAIDALEKIGDWREPTAAADAAVLIGSRGALHQVIYRLSEQAVGTLKTRIHGDFHLGQILVSDGDVYLIDFEGEPARTLAERRGKFSPLRDVAGMLRSFDYARAMAGAESETHRPMLESLHHEAVAAFLDAYRTAHAAAPTRWASETAEPALLDLFLIQKAAYEISYEAANRVAWIPVPLHGLAELASRLLTDKAPQTNG